MARPRLALLVLALTSTAAFNHRAFGLNDDSFGHRGFGHRGHGYRGFGHRGFGYEDSMPRVVQLHRTHSVEEGEDAFQVKIRAAHDPAFPARADNFRLSLEGAPSRGGDYLVAKELVPTLADQQRIHPSQRVDLRGAFEKKLLLPASLVDRSGIQWSHEMFPGGLILTVTIPKRSAPEPEPTLAYNRPNHQSHNTVTGRDDDYDRTFANQKAAAARRRREQQHQKMNQHQEAQQSQKQESETQRSSARTAKRQQGRIKQSRKRRRLKQQEQHSASGSQRQQQQQQQQQPGRDSQHSHHLRHPEQHSHDVDEPVYYIEDGVEILDSDEDDTDESSTVQDPPFGSIFSGFWDNRGEYHYWGAQDERL